MSEIPFHSTRMGQRYYEGTMPALVRELARLNGNIERLLVLTDGAVTSENAAAKEGASEDNK